MIEDELVPEYVRAMEMASKSTDSEDVLDPDYFNDIKVIINNELDNMKKIINKINQMRVETAYLQSDMLLMIDVSTWEDITELIGPALMKMDDIDVKKEMQ